MPFKEDLEGVTCVISNVSTLKGLDILLPIVLKSYVTTRKKMATFLKNVQSNHQCEMQQLSLPFPALLPLLLILFL